jgi:hypothetical protein
MVCDNPEVKLLFFIFLEDLWTVFDGAFSNVRVVFWRWRGHLFRHPRVPFGGVTYCYARIVFPYPAALARPALSPFLQVVLVDERGEGCS